jgi:hypothetical protein
MAAYIDVAPENRSTVNESPYPARLGRGFHHETYQAYDGTDNTQAQDRRAADRPGQDLVEVCRVFEVTQSTYHRWLQHYGGMQGEETRRLTQLEEENARLKVLLAEAELEKAMLKELAEGNF